MAGIVAGGTAVTGVAANTGLETLIGARTGNCSVNAAGPSACMPMVAERSPTDCST